MAYQIGDTILGKYKLLGAVGGGGMGQVYKAEHLLMHKQVALKVLHHNVRQSEEMVARFKREAQAASSIDHANICHVMDFDITEDGAFFLVMEYLEGLTLREVVAQKGPLKPAQIVGIINQLLSVLQCAHTQGIVHRDIKPDNIIIINKDGNEFFVKLLDFGIAHKTEDEVPHELNEEPSFKTQAGMLYGTPEYIAPEQANGEEIDYRVDLYACGIILYELLMGKVPFSSPSLIKVLNQQVSEPPPHLNPELPFSEEFDAIIQKLLSKNREDRYSSAQEVIDALLAIEIEPPQTASIMPSQTALEIQSFLDKITYATRWAFAKICILIKRPDWVEKIDHFITPRRVLFLFIFAVCCLVGIITASVVSSLSTPVEVEIVRDESQQVVPQKLLKITDIQPYAYGAVGLAISEDQTLRKDPNLLKTYEDYYNRNYQDAYDNLLAVQYRYDEHPNYLRMRVIVAAEIARSKDVKDDYRQKLYNNIILDFVELAKKVPDAARNPYLRDAVTQAISKFSLKSPESLLSLFQSLNHASLPRALAYMIIYEPYDRNLKLKDKLLEVFDQLDPNDTPEWQRITLDAWRLNKSECTQREELIQQAIKTKASKETLYYGVIVPLYEHLRLNVKESKRYQCKKGSKSIDCNDCMKSWIESSYATWMD